MFVSPVFYIQSMDEGNYEPLKLISDFKFIKSLPSFTEDSLVCTIRP